MLGEGLGFKGSFSLFWASLQAAGAWKEGRVKGLGFSPPQSCFSHMMQQFGSPHTLKLIPSYRNWKLKCVRLLAMG